MKIIECLSGKIEDELHDAEEYIEDAIKWRAEMPDVAELFYQLSLEEMGHMERLHKKVAEKIAEYKNTHGEPPKDMLALYDYLHKQHINEAMKIRVMQGMYKEA